MKNYYETLEIPNFSSIAEVKKAFKKLAVLYHPDKNPDDKTAEEKFKEINEAYQILSDETAKERYDSLLAIGYTQEDLKNEYFSKNPTENQKRKEAQRAAWQQYVKRKTEPKPYEMSNTQAFLLSALFVVYLLVFVNNFIDFYARLHYLWAVEAVENKQYKVAINHLERSMAADRKFAKAYFLAGKVQMQHFKLYAVAVEKLTHAIEFTEKPHHEYNYLRGLAYAHLGVAKESSKDFDFVLQQYPDSLELKEKIADHYYHILQNDNLSEKLFSELLKKNAKNHYFLVNLADIAFRKRSFETAISYYSKSIDFGNTKVTPYQKRSLCYLELQNVPKACEDWQKAKQIDNTIKDETLDFFCSQRVD